MVTQHTGFNVTIWQQSNITIRQPNILALMLLYHMATKHTGFNATTWQPNILGLMLPYSNQHTGFEIILYFIITLWICSTYLFAFAQDKYLLFYIPLQYISKHF